MQDRLRSLRGDVSQKDWAEKLTGFSQSYISQVESGVVKNPSIAYLMKISLITEVNLHWLLTGEGEAKRLAAKATKKITDLDRAELICSYIDEMGCGYEAREVVKNLIRLAVKDHRTRDEVIRYFEFLEFKRRHEP